ncbi:MAG TPA: hypothetical protein VNK23_04345 [Candidatus Dormibacteraeota bacterium]|nr:hypothetical protein [Candidatus Dormibacteraeota bacterium]
MNLIRSRRGASPAQRILVRAGAFAIALAAIFAAIPASARQQNSSSATSTPELRAYVGTWKASFQGKVFAILVLREKHGSLEGTLNNFAIAVDKQGNLADGTHIDIGVSQLISPRFKNGALIFTVAQKDAYSQTTDWSFVVKNSREGELTENLDTQLEAPMSMVVKPIPMHRASTR